MNGHNDKLFQASVALNNMGIVLMERGLYDKAVSTLKEAVEVLKIVFINDREPDGCRSIPLLLHNAFLRMAMPAMVLGQEPYRASVELIAHDEQDFESIQRILLTNSNRSFFPLRMESIERNAILSKQTWGASIVIYNMAVAKVLIARSSKNPRKIESFSRCALRLFVMSRKIVHEYSEQCEQERDYARLQQLHLVSCLSMKQELDLLFRLGQLSKAQETYDSLLHVIAAMEDMGNLLYGGKCSAAAA
jgi:tetratricopeptide (TPR) repeat protein|uniref:Uncharacterized protein n=1 Tax=Phaeodactylum tricornutum TaxID=2850 RepID=A0A8J9SCL8_PHATR